MIVLGLQAHNHWGGLISYFNADRGGQAYAEARREFYRFAHTSHALALPPDVAVVRRPACKWCVARESH